MTIRGDSDLDTAFTALNAFRGELVRDYTAALREALFGSRAYIRPSDVARIANTDVDLFLAFVVDRDEARVEVHGEHLGHIGLQSQVVFDVGRILRSFCTHHLDELSHDALNDAIDAYHQALLRGFVKAREAIILEEQERIRSALQRSVSRYTAQIETAAEIARVATSGLDLDPLLHTAAALLRQRFELAYIAIYLVEADGTHAILRAQSGVDAESVLVLGHTVPIDESSSLGWCIRNLKPRTAPAPENRPATSGLPSELDVPLILSGQVNGAMVLQSYRPSAFSAYDVGGLQIIANQLANAIQQANLFAELRRRADELATANVRLRELDRLKDEFIQNVSHELRTPLTIVAGYVDLLQSGDLGALNETQRNAVQNIAYSSDALLALVNDIMSILEVEGRPATPVTFSVAHLLEASLANFQRMAAEKQITLQAELPQACQIPSIVGVPDQIRRVIDNLLNNALKFTPAQGRVSVVLWYEAGEIVFSVQDTGIGIAADQLERVFERFYQVDGSIRRYFGGTGLGLALSQQIVQLHQGTISVQSPGLGQGSTFTVRLPVNVPADGG